MKKFLIRNHSPDNELAGSRDTGLLLEIRLLGGSVSAICGAALASGARFCTSFMD